MATELMTGLRDAMVWTRQDLLASGVPRRAIDGALRRGDLVRVAHGVYAEPHHDRDSPQFRWALALAATQPDGVLSHLTAAAARGLTRPRPGEPVHVTVPHGRGRPVVPGVVVHQTTRFEHHRHQGWPIVGVRDMAISLASGDIDDLRYPVLAAVQQGLLSPGDLADVTGVPRSSRSRWKLVAEEALAGAESGAEGRYWRALKEARLPLPRLNVALTVDGHRYRLDALWEQWALVAEVDGLRYHTDGDAFRDDRTRQNRIHSSGLVVIRFTANEVRYDTAAVIAMTESNLITRGFRPTRRRTSPPLDHDRTLGGCPVCGCSGPGRS